MYSNQGLLFIFLERRFSCVWSSHSSEFEESRCLTPVRLCCLNRAHAGFRVWLGRSTGKPYRRMPLDSRCATTRAELSGVTHGGTKTRVGLGIELTTSHKA